VGIEPGQVASPMDRRRWRSDREQGRRKYWKPSGLSETSSSTSSGRFPKTSAGPGQARATAEYSWPPLARRRGIYELQILDSYNNKTYVNGQAGSIYKQSIPLVNPNRKPGEWQNYDVVWTAPRFNSDGSLKTPAYVTVLFNGVLVQITSS